MSRYTKAFRDDLESLIKQHLKMDDSARTAEVLAEYVIDSLKAFDKAAVGAFIWTDPRRRADETDHERGA